MQTAIEEEPCSLDNSTSHEDSNRRRNVFEHCLIISDDGSSSSFLTRTFDSLFSILIRLFYPQANVLSFNSSITQVSSELN